MLTALGSETHDTNLGIVCPKMGLDDATADRFAKQNNIKAIKQWQQSKIYNKRLNTKDEVTFNIPSCNFSRKSL